MRHAKIEARARKSWRGKVWRAWDRSMGWVVVSLVGELNMGMVSVTERTVF
jgi:hypothetical protein